MKQELGNSALYYKLEHLKDKLPCRTEPLHEWKNETKYLFYENLEGVA